MKTKRDKGSGIISYVYRGLIICLMSLALILIGGTIYGFFFQGPAPNSVQIDILNDGMEGQAQTFTGIGQIRISTADPQPVMVILFISFNYFPEDRAFSEELALRVRDLREIALEYIGSFTAGELQSLSEESIKAELLRRFNAVLRLGQIDVLFFSDFMIIG